MALRKKGQSQVISHSLSVLFSMILILAVISTMNTIEKDYGDYTGKFQAREICSIMKAAVEKVYNPISANISMNTTQEMGYYVIYLPQKAGNEPYEITFFNSTVKVEGERLNQTCEIGINSSFMGISSGGKTKISWLFGNGTDSVKIEKT